MSLTPKVDSCRCGHECQLKTSWSPSNPGRRFYGCRIEKDKGGCNYFRWVDDEFPSQANRVIWGLLNRVKTFEEERARVITWRKKLAYIIVIMLIIWVCYCVVDRCSCCGLVVGVVVVFCVLGAVFCICNGG